MLENAERIAERLTESVDPSYYASLNSQLRYAFGEPWNQSGSSGRVFPSYPQIKLQVRKVGRSMKILANTLVELSSIMGTEPEPEWIQLHKYISESRKQVFLERWNRYSWRPEFEKTYLDATLLGLGILQWGVREEGGLQYVTCEHCPLQDVLKDPHYTDPAKWRYVGLARHLDPDDAILLYGNRKKIEDNIVTIDDDGPRKAVRIIEYWDIGIGGKDPTHAVILSDVDGDPLFVEKNAFGRLLPISYAEHVILPGFKHHIGRVIMQMAEQEARNKIEAALLKSAQDYGYDIVNTDRIDKLDYEKGRRNGSTHFYAKSAAPGDNQPAIDRIAAREISNTAMQLMYDLDKQLNAMSGTNDLERGNLTQQTRTLGEIQLLDQRSQQTRSRMLRQTALMYVRAIKMWQALAMKYDETPAYVDVFGNNILFNNPNDVRSSFRQLFEEPSEVVINPTSLYGSDYMAKRQARLTELMMLRGDPSINPLKVAEEIVKTLGDDPSEWVVQPMAMQQPAMNIPAPAGQEMNNGRTA